MSGEDVPGNALKMACKSHLVLRKVFFWGSLGCYELKNVL